MNMLSAVAATFRQAAASPRLQRGTASRAARAKGLTLVELLVAIALSLLIMTALVALYVNLSRANSETTKANRLIENGRFAIQVLQSDLIHAGFWGGLEVAGPTAVPDPCLAYAKWPGMPDDPNYPNNPDKLREYKANLLAIPVQGYANGDAVSGCGVSGVLPASDVLVVRHADTCVAGSCDGADDEKDVNIQLSACSSPAEAPYVIGLGSAASTFALHVKATGTVALTNPAACSDTYAPRRKLLSNIYYAGTSDGIPNLMRITFENGAYQTPQPMVEGIEAFRLEYGIDDLGSNGLPISGINPGDGSADRFVSCAPCDLATLTNVVSVKVHVLARNLEPTPGHKDTKSYQLGPLTVAAANDNFKRHVFTTTVRLVNPSSRREMP